jgi:hypothetical protein
VLHHSIPKASALDPAGAVKWKGKTQEICFVWFSFALLFCGFVVTTKLMGPPLQFFFPLPVRIFPSHPGRGGRCTTQESNHTRLRIKVNFMGYYAA